MAHIAEGPENPSGHHPPAFLFDTLIGHEERHECQMVEEDRGSGLSAENIYIYVTLVHIELINNTVTIALEPGFISPPHFNFAHQAVLYLRNTKTCAAK